uniref:Uncharacterized protein n=1 Tax=Pyrodinium bahamense TaxID=73915 RepID=A0A7S0FT57_9DINO
MALNAEEGHCTSACRRIAGVATDKIAAALSEDSTRRHKQPGVRCVHTSNAGNETSGDDRLEKAEAVHGGGGASHLEGRAQQAPGDGSIVRVASDAERKKSHVRWANDIGDGSGKTPAGEGAERAHEETATFRGRLKKTLPRSKAKQWLLSQGFEAHGPLIRETMWEIGAIYRDMRKADGAGYQAVHDELFQVLHALASIDATKGGTGEEAGVDLEDVFAAAWRWLQWYALLLLRSA